MEEDHGRARELAEQLSQKTAQFRALQHVSSLINATLDLDEIYTLVLHTMDKLFGFEHAIILLLDETSDHLTVVASRGYEDQPIGGKVPVGTGVIGVVAKRQQVMRVGNLRAKRAYASAVRREMEMSGDEVGEVVPVPGLPDADSQIAIPLLVRDALIGVFSVESRDRTAFDEHDEDLVAIVANQAASAIHNARLYQDVEQRRMELAEAHEHLRRLNETLELRVQERTAELQNANRELRRTQAQLVQSGKMAALGRMVAGIAHEINTPVGAMNAAQNSLKRAVSKLKDRMESNCPEQLASDAVMKKSMEATEASRNIIEESSSHVAEIVRRFRSFARLDEAELQQADIHECLEDTLALIQHELRGGIEVAKDYGEIPKVLCYPGRLNQVFLNLLYNACQAIESNGKIVITTRVVGDEIHIGFRDNGSGIAAEYLDKIFDPGFTTKGVGVGTGLGLSICYEIVRDHNGRID
ncbi:MAG: GAF domain-containing protein, partial [Rhodothermales bacterium]|nr:GAF domain-containing protein [Rhodothermales bacterium]